MTPPKTEREKCLAGLEYDSADPELIALIVQARELTKTYNQHRADDAPGRRDVLGKLLGGIGENAYIDTPFYCDYGKHIFVGANVYIGLNCTFVDNNHVIIGDNALIASGVNISTATHPVSAAERIISDPNRHNTYRTFSAPVTIGSGAWIGAGATIIPGVTIGENAVIGAGSVVVKDIPANCVAVGNPCHVLTPL